MKNEGSGFHTVANSSTFGGYAHFLSNIVS